MDQEAVHERAGKIAERATHKIDELKGEAQDLYGRGKDRALELRDNVDHYVQDQPMRSVLIAAGVGLCLGLILARR